MGKIGKVLVIIVLFFLVAIAGLIAFVHYYLTDEKVKALVIPQAEAALGRKVAIGDIKIGLLSGITIHDFLIKEADQQQNFVSTRAFVLSYDLLPLLQKKLIISEIRFDEPAIQITRDAKGKFNFSSLALLSEKPAQREEKKTSTATAALPLALTFDKISFNRAQIKIRDQLNEIPGVDATTSAQLNVALGQTIKDLQFKGSFDLDAAVLYGEAQARFEGKGTISQKDFDMVLDTNVDGELIHTEAAVKSYLQAPDATLNISSKSLNIDKLLAMVAGLPTTEISAPRKTQTATAKTEKIIADSLPPGLIANGTVKVDKALYKKVTTNNFSLIFNLEKGILTLKELSAQAYNGKLESNVIVDLNQPGLAYNGNLGLISVQAGDLGSALIQKAEGMLSGSLQTKMTFSGAGTTWDELKNVLTADGSFTLLDGGIKGTPVSNTIASLLGLQELNNITYKNISGTFKIVEGGKARINTTMEAVDVKAEADGIIGLDGSLDLPLTLHLAPPLAAKLQAMGSFTKYISDEQGDTTLHLKLAGTLASPKPTLDMKGTQEQMQKSIQKELLKQLEPSGQQDSSQKKSPENIIKGLFGR
jgi:AsmA protein